jgi:hypothetical protein
VATKERPWGGRRILPHQIEQKELQIGFPSGSMNEEQLAVFEKLGRYVQKINASNPSHPPIHIKLTPIE